KDLDQLACVLEAAEIGAVVDDLLREGAAEAWYRHGLSGGRGVEGDSGEDGAGCTLGERNFDLLAVFEATGQVGQAGDVRLDRKAAGGGNGVVDAVPAPHSIQARVLDGADDVDQKAGRRGHVRGRCGSRRVRRRRVWPGGAGGVCVRARDRAATQQHRKGDGKEPLPARDESDVIAHGLEARACVGGSKPSLLRPRVRAGWFRGKDSNLRSRIQSPLPYLLATPERLPGGRGRLAPVDARSRLQSMQNASVAPAGYAKGTAGVGSVGENRASGPSRGRHDGVWRLSISGRGLDGHGDRQRPGDGGSVC